MKYRMGAAFMSMVGVFVASYLYLYKIGKIGTMACGTGGCETVQTSEWARFARQSQLPVLAENAFGERKFV